MPKKKVAKRTFITDGESSQKSDEEIWEILKFWPFVLFAVDFLQ